MKAEVFAEQVLLQLGPIPLTATMASSAGTSLLLVTLGVLLARAVQHDPGGPLAAAGRLTFAFLRDLVRETAGRPAPVLEIFAGTLFLFIAGTAVVGQLPGVAAPTANLPAAAALAALVFFAAPLAGIRARGLQGYVGHYFRPNPIFFPFHVISELSRTLALALRLFGNMMSGHMVVILLVALVGPLVPIPLMVLDLLIGFLQAYIFTILASVYIGAAIREGEED
ncbi:MAG: F0F1 ATP synthase subunit A [Gammaproteobacteria bacterium]